MRMSQPGGEFDLAKKAVGSDFRGHLGSQDFERYVALMSQVLSEKDNSHSTLAKLALKCVSAFEASIESLFQIYHGHGICFATAPVASVAADLRRVGRIVPNGFACLFCWGSQPGDARP
jgi:hypothetical protein